jgi:chromatin segregation and condensation protein Rec8/ScpA/Scc1 (kleisin family)
MKQFFAAAAVLALLSATALAQVEGKLAGADQLARMQKNLGLSDEQMAQLHELRERGGSREEVRAVFTDEQWAQMQERRRQAKARRGKGQPGQYYSLPQDGQADKPDDG